MKKRYNKAKLVQISKKIETIQKITPQDVETLLAFEKSESENAFLKFLGSAALPLSIALGVWFTVDPDIFAGLTTFLPSWTNLPPQVLAGVDYVWNILSEPVEKANIIYHLPNIALYSFGILGIKKLFDAIDRKTWLQKTLEAKEKLQQHIRYGYTNFSLAQGHSILFVGSGDFIGMQFALNNPDAVATVSEVKPRYTNIWSYYSAETLYQDLEHVLIRTDAVTAGEYLFFPVKDDQIFLPGPNSYDLSPHKLDILCQNIRMIEKSYNWPAKRIIIIGDKYHQSYVESQDKTKSIKNSQDAITLESIAQKYENITLLDPTDIVLKKIIEIAQGRKIVFRATKQGLAEYKNRFYSRLEELGYKSQAKSKGILTIGYDLFEDQTEQQTLARKIDSYFPVVLSKNVCDALIRNGYKPEEFLYVPELVLAEVTQEASEQ